MHDPDTARKYLEQVQILAVLKLVRQSKVGRILPLGH